jgi:hypothetical protein
LCTRWPTLTELLLLLKLRLNNLRLNNLRLNNLNLMVSNQVDYQLSRVSNLLDLS